MRLVKIEDLKPGMMVAQDLVTGANSYIPLLKKNSILNESIIRELRFKDVKFLYILEKTEWPANQKQENQSPAREIYIPQRKPTIDIKLRDEALQSIEEIFTSAALYGQNLFTPSAQVIKHVDTVVEQLVASIQKEPSAIVNINDLKSYDEYTFHHSLSVAILSLAIAQHIGFDTEKLKRMGVCAIMHDIGKTAVPIEIIQKTSRLDNDEFSIIKGHPTAGYDYLIKSEVKDDEILQGVLHHHEKFEGGGYPDGLAENDIPLWSRIVSVADVYDALTSNRPYRIPMQPGEAVEYIMGGVGSLFDFDTVTAFVNKLELYPLGSRLELSDGKTVVVLNNENQLRPVVRDVNTGLVIDLYRDRAYLSVVVKRLIDENDDYL